MRLLLFLPFIAVISPASAIEFHVAPNGHDGWPGNAARPFATLERARDAVRAIRSGREAGGVTVWIHEGEYRLMHTFALDSLDSGTEQDPTVYRSYGTDIVRITGGRRLDPGLFQHITDADQLSRLAPEGRGGIVVADLHRAGISNFGELRQYGHSLPVVPAPLELFFNDHAMIIARYPNRGEIPMGRVTDPGSVPRIGDNSGRGGSFVYTDPRHNRWAQCDDVWLRGTFMWGYADDMIRIAAIDTVRHTIRLASPHLYGLGSGEPFRQYHAINILGELDEPGEYYLDRSTGRLLFWPPGDLATAGISVSESDGPLIALEGTSHIILRGLIIECTRGIGVYIERGEGNVIAGCVIRNTGTIGVMMGQGSVPSGPGIQIDGTEERYRGTAVSREIGDLQNHLYNNTVWDRLSGKGHGVLSCEIYNTGSGGVFLGGGSKKDLVAGGSFVENCRIHDYNRRNKFLWAGVDVDGCGNRVTHNEIYNSDSQGIYVHGNDHMFEYNLIHDVALNSDDTSPWYLGRDPSDRGNVVRYNFFHHIGRPDRMVMGVYLDDGTCGTLIEGNVLYKTATYGAVYSNAGQDNIVRNNIIVESYGPAVHLKSMWYDFAQDAVGENFGPHGLYRRRLTRYVDIHRPPYSTRYPALQNFLDLMPDSITYVGMIPQRNVVEGNVIVRCPEVLRLTAPHAAFDMRNNLVTDDDPGFIDDVRMNFGLKTDALVYRVLPGFTPIPFEAIGPHRDEYRTW